MREHYPLVIVGAGPAGLSASLNATRHKLSHLVLEKGEIANTVPSLAIKLNQVFMLRFLQNMFPECDATIPRFGGLKFCGNF